MRRDMKAAYVRERPFLLTVLVLVLAWICWVNFWTAPRFYRLDRVHVSDARAGEPILMQVDRTVVRDFRGAYATKVVSLPAKSPVCAGGESVPYERDSTLPNPLTLAWWTYGASPPCMSVLTPGKYRLTSCITIHPGLPFISDLHTCAVSNDFEVTP